MYISCRGSMAKAKPRKLAEAAQDDSAPGGGAAANRMSMTAASKSRLLTNPRPGPPPPPVVSGIHMVLRLDAPDEVCLQRRADLLREFCQRFVMYISLSSLLLRPRNLYFPRDCPLPRRCRSVYKWRLP